MGSSPKKDGHVCNFQRVLFTTICQRLCLASSYIGKFYHIFSMGFPLISLGIASLFLLRWTLPSDLGGFILNNLGESPGKGDNIDIIG